MSCAYAGKPELYGLGIRTAFYLQWFGTITAQWLTRSEVPGLRYITILFISGAFLSLIILASSPPSKLYPLDVYLTLLLTYGSFYTLIPIYLWKLITVCNPYADPHRWPRVRMTGLYRRVMLLLVVATSCFQIWFWSLLVPNTDSRHALARAAPTPRATETDGEGKPCRDWGFFFAKAELRSPPFVAANFVFVILVLAGASLALVAEMGVLEPPGGWMARRERHFRKMVKRLEQRGEVYPWRREVQFGQTVSDLTVLSVLVIAIELTLQWNSVTDVNDVSTLGQLVPLMVAAGMVAHVPYVWFNPYHNAEILEDLLEDMPEASSSGGHSKRSRSHGSPAVEVVIMPEDPRS